MTNISILKIIESTSVDGPGLRTSIYSAGCEHHCPLCQNPQSWDIANGTPTSIDDIMRIIADNDFCNVTFSGGDPMYQAEGFAELARRIKTETDKTIWCYTGFTFEQLLSSPSRVELLRNVDILVDGPYIEELRSEELMFRGSSNQRILDVRASLAAHRAVEYYYNPLPFLVQSAEHSNAERRVPII